MMEYSRELSQQDIINAVAATFGIDFEEARKQIANNFGETKTVDGE